MVILNKLVVVVVVVTLSTTFQRNLSSILFNSFSDSFGGWKDPTNVNVLRDKKRFDYCHLTVYRQASSGPYINKFFNHV